MKPNRGFTLVELTVVVLIVGVLAAISTPIVRGRIDSAKWTEAKAAAGALKTAIRAYLVSTDPGRTNFSEVEGSLGSSSIARLLGFAMGSLNGTFFNQSDYTISDVSGANGTCIVTVISTHPQGPAGTGVLAANGTWSVTTGSG
jgi:prepilin-type N-terminal cleavage/methylation domain-containing protein